jgi:hypothetical protein
MWPFSQWTTAGRAALIYITVGALTVIWAGVWYVYLFNNPPAESAYYWCTPGDGVDHGPHRLGVGHDQSLGPACGSATREWSLGGGEPPTERPDGPGASAGPP